jgi:hypothetical protein
VRAHFFGGPKDGDVEVMAFAPPTLKVRFYPIVADVVINKSPARYALYLKYDVAQDGSVVYRFKETVIEKETV